jgi:hypothetical protein
LATLLFVQSLSGESENVLAGSFVDGFDASVFKLVPSDRLVAQWTNVDDRMLIPIATKLLLRDGVNSTEAEVVNIQVGFVVVRIGEAMSFRKFNLPGWQTLFASLLDLQQRKVQAINEAQQKMAADLALYNGQSP